MAQASTITNEVRRETTTLLDALYEADRIVHLFEDPGANDAARAAFFRSYLEDAQGEPVTDITWAEFVAAVTALRALQTWLTTNRPALAKLIL